MTTSSLETRSKKPAYQILRGEGYLTLKLSGALDPEMVKIFEDEVLPELFQGAPSHIVVNCENLSSLSKPWFRILLGIVHKTKQLNKETRFILVSQTMKTLFRTEGVDKALKISINLREALVDLGLVTKKALDVDFINPFLDSTIHVLKVQALVESKAQKFFIKKEKDRFSGDISGVIGIVSESFNGSVVVSFPEATFLKIMSKMMGENFTSITKEISDGAAEITNIIFGQSKLVLNEKGYGIKTALPSVVTGRDHSVLSLTTGPVVVVPFETEVGPFFIEICLST